MKDDDVKIVKCIHISGRRKDSYIIRMLNRVLKVTASTITGKFSLENSKENGCKKKKKSLTRSYKRKCKSDIYCIYIFLNNYIILTTSLL